MVPILGPSRSQGRIGEHIVPYGEGRIGEHIVRFAVRETDELLLETYKSKCFKTSGHQRGKRRGRDNIGGGE